MSPDCPGDAWRFEIYIAGDNRRSKLAMENLKAICKDYLGGRCYIDVIDIRGHPEKVGEKKIIAVPTLIRTYPKPERILVGDLSKIDKVLQSLDIECPVVKPPRTIYSEGLSKQGLCFKWNHIPQ